MIIFIKDSDSEDDLSDVPPSSPQLMTKLTFDGINSADSSPMSSPTQENCPNHSSLSRVGKILI